MEILFEVAWFGCLLFIIFVFYFIFKNTAKSYFKMPVEDVRYLIDASQKSFFVNHFSCYGKNDNILGKCFKGFKSNVPFVFKVYFLPNCLVLTMFNQYATVFERDKCKFTKKNFFSYFKIETDTAKYNISTGFHHKFVNEWLGKY